MNLFGIPLFIPISELEMFITELGYSVSSDMMVLLYFFVNFMYIYCLYLLIKFVYKVIMFVVNHVFG